MTTKIDSVIKSTDKKIEDLIWQLRLMEKVSTGTSVRVEYRAKEGSVHCLRNKASEWKEAVVAKNLEWDWDNYEYRIKREPRTIFMARNAFGEFFGRAYSTHIGCELAIKVDSDDVDIVEFKEVIK